MSKNLYNRGIDEKAKPLGFFWEACWESVSFTYSLYIPEKKNEKGIDLSHRSDILFPVLGITRTQKTKKLVQK